MYVANDLATIASTNDLPHAAAITASVGTDLKTEQLRSFTTLTAQDGVYYSKAFNVLVIHKAGVTLDGFDFRGVSINVQADDFTVKNSLFDASTGIYAINAFPGTKNLTVETSTFDGLKLDKPSYVDFITSRGENTVVKGNAFLDAPSDAVSIESGTISGNYFAGAAYAKGVHADAIWIGKTTGPVVISENTIDWRSRADAPAETNNPIRITGENGNVSDVTVSKNIILGGSMTVLVSDGPTWTHSASQVGTVTGVRIVDNVIDFGKFGSLEQTYRPADMVYVNNHHASGAAKAPGIEATGTLPDLSTLNKLVAASATAVIKGTGGNDHIIGGSGSNPIYGGAGDDVIEGGDGRDFVSGGEGNDIFVFRSLTGSGRDHISDFESGKDRIHLADLDGAPGSLDGWQWLGAESFTGHEWQLRYQAGPSTTTVEIDVDGDLKADFRIDLLGSIALKAGDFILAAKAETPAPAPQPSSPIEQIEAPSTEFPTVATSLDFLGGRIETGSVSEVTVNRSADGRLISTVFDNGSYNRIEYDTEGRPKQFITRHDDGSRSLDQYTYDGSFAAYRHLEYDSTGKQILEQRFDADGVKTYETLQLETGGKTSMLKLSDGIHNGLFNALGDIVVNEHIQLDGSHVTSAKAEGQRIEGSAYDDHFTSFGGDTFVFKGEFGNDVIRNFKAASLADSDRLELSSQVKLEDIYLSYSRYDLDTVIHVGDLGTINLRDIHLNSIKDVDILFI